MANVIESEVEVSVERQAQLTPSLCNWGWGSYVVKWVCDMGGIVKQ